MQQATFDHQPIFTSFWREIGGATPRRTELQYQYLSPKSNKWRDCDVWQVPIAQRLGAKTRVIAANDVKLH